MTNKWSKNSLIMTFNAVLIIFLISVALSACGRKGPLQKFEDTIYPQEYPSN